MAKAFSKQFYSSSRWIKARARYISTRQSIDGGLCEDCSKKLGFILHHKIPLTPSNIDDPMLSTGADNLKYVCKDCHELYDSRGHIKPSVIVPCAFDSQGNPVEKPGTPPFNAEIHGGF